MRILNVDPGSKAPNMTPSSLPARGADRLARQLAFLDAVDALKRVRRASRITDDEHPGGGRHENSAEHSWHVALFAEILAEHANEPIDTARVVRMLLVHDIVEIDVGDTPLHGAQPVDKAEREAAAAARLFALLPGDQRDTLEALWHEFESGTGIEARFARAIDRLQPMRLNAANRGGTWNDYAVGEQQLRERTGHIAVGAEPLWAHCEALIAQAIDEGWLTASAPDQAR